MSTEPPIYRRFAVAALAATLVGGTPLGIWLASWLYLGTPAVPIDWILLHPHLQIFGFFAVLIAGMALQLFAHFTGRTVTRWPTAGWVLGLLVSGMITRVSGTWAHWPWLIVMAACLEAAGFGLFGLSVWHSLDSPSLVAFRRQLTFSTGWFGLACLVEAGLRGRALQSGLTLPDVGGLRAAHTMGLFGGVIGWVLGVLLHAGPMFLHGLRPSLATARALPWVLGLGVSMAAAGEAATWTPAAGAALSRFGEFIVLASAGAVMVVLGGAITRNSRGLPMVGHGAGEARIFRLAVFSAGLAMIGSATATVAACSGFDVRLLTDAVRHLVTVGFLTSVVVGTAFQLIPVLEERPLPWPRLRGLAFWALLVAILFRSGELFVGHGWNGRAPGVPLSGVLVWLALACVAANLLMIITARRRSVDPSAAI